MRTETGPIGEELRHSVRALLSPKATRMVFYAACALWIVYNVLYASYFFTLMDTYLFSTDSVGYFVTLMVLVCELGVVCGRGYERRDAYALVALIAMCVGPLSRSSGIMVQPALLVFCGRSFDVRRSMMVCAAALASALLLVLAGAGVGVVDDTVLTDLGRVRHFLGFLFCLNPSMCLFTLTCCICYLRGEAMTMVECALLLVANALMFVLTKAATSFWLPLALVLAVLSLRLPFVRERKLNRLWAVLSWSMVIALLASLALTMLYGLSHEAGIGWLDGVNKMTRGRLAYGYNGIKEYGFTALGQYVPWQGNGLSPFGYNPQIADYNYVDNMFVHVLLDQGWVWMLGYVVLCTGVTRKAFRDGDRVLLLTMAAMAAYCVLNDLTMYFHYNLLLMLIAGLYDVRPTAREGVDS